MWRRGVFRESDAMSVIEVTELRKSYGGRTVVDGVSFAVEEGEIFGILGGVSFAVFCLHVSFAWMVSPT